MGYTTEFEGKFNLKVSSNFGGINWNDHRSLAVGSKIKYLGLGYCPDCCKIKMIEIISGYKIGLFGKKPKLEEIRITPKEVPQGEFKGGIYCLNCGHITGIKFTKKRGKK